MNDLVIIRGFTKDILFNMYFGLISIKEKEEYNKIVDKYILTITLFYTKSKCKPITDEIHILHTSSKSVRIVNVEELDIYWLELYKEFFNFILLMSTEALFIQFEKLNSYKK